MKKLAILLFLGLSAHQAKAMDDAEFKKYRQDMLEISGIKGVTDKNLDEKWDCFQDIRDLQSELKDSTGDYGEFTSESHSIQRKIDRKGKRCNSIK